MKKRLLIYSDCYTFSGSENVVLNILSSNALQREYDVRFFYRHSVGYEQKLKRMLPGDQLHSVKPLHLKRFSDLFYHSNYPSFVKRVFFKIDQVFDFFFLYYLIWLPVFVKEIRKAKPTVVHINNGGYPGATSCLAFAFACRLCKINKVIMHVNNLAFKRKWYAVQYFLLDKCLQGAINSFVTGSKAAAVCLQQRRGVSENKIVNINNTILKDQLAATGNLFIEKPAEEVWIGFVGLLTKRKGVNCLIEAVHLLKHEFRDKGAKLIIVGDGEEEVELKRAVIKKGLDDLIVFTGFTSEVSKYFNQFDVFVLPSLSNEDFPYVLLEAMITRKPVISTRVAGIPEIVLNNRTGYLIAPGDVCELSQKIRILINDSAKRIEMGRGGYERYHSLFSYEKTMKKLSELYSLS